MTTLHVTEDGHLTAIALVRAYAARDDEGFSVLARHCDPGSTIAALVGSSTCARSCPKAAAPPTGWTLWSTTRRHSSPHSYKIREASP